MEIGENIRKNRKKCGFTQEYLAERLNVSTTEVENLPESQEKHHAMTDDLMYGWLLPSEKNDILLARIKSAEEIKKVFKFLKLSDVYHANTIAAISAGKFSEKKN